LSQSSEFGRHFVLLLEWLLFISLSTQSGNFCIHPNTYIFTVHLLVPWPRLSINLSRWHFFYDPLHCA